MYNLSLEGTGRQGYFRWKEDICAFISRHWTFLLGSRSVGNGKHTPPHTLVKPIFRLVATCIVMFWKIKKKRIFQPDRTTLQVSKR